MENFGEHYIGGYVGKNWKETTVENDDDWYFVTKTVVHCLAQNNSPKSKYIVPTRTAASDHLTLEEAQRRGSKILEEAEKLYWYAMNNSDNYEEAKISLSKSGNLQESGNMLIQNYNITSNKALGNYDIFLDRFPTGTTYEKNQNSLKIKIPKNNINNDFKGYIYIDNVQVKTCPVFYAKSTIQEYQDYIIAGDPYEITSARSNLEIDGKKSGILIKKIDEETGKPLGNVTFDIKKDNKLVKQVTTNEKGEASLSNIYAGEYKIVEVKTNAEYELPINNSKVINIKYGENISVEFTNKRKRGNLQVLKTAEDGMVEGKKFRLYGTSLIGDYINLYATTNARGIAEFKNILISGNQGYTLEEVDTGIQYVVPNQLNVSIKWNETAKATITNNLKKFKVTLTKTDSENGKEQGNASLAGAIYGLYNDGELIDTYTTDSKGQFTTKYYTCGNSWTIKEIEASEGYLLDSKIYNVGAEPKKYNIEYNSISFSVTEQIKKGKINIIKHTDNGNTQIETPEVNARFEVYLKSAGSYKNAKDTERDIITCDADGFCQTKELPYGIYVVHQVYGWEDTEYIADFEVYISENQKTYKFLINNAKFESYIKIIKVDQETGKTIKMAGAGFKIYDSNKKLITMTYTYPQTTTIDTFYTNTDGYLITPQKLETGKFYLQEVQAPYRICLK